MDSVLITSVPPVLPIFLGYIIMSWSHKTIRVRAVIWIKNKEKYMSASNITKDINRQL
jgi:hypothetical protein